MWMWIYIGLLLVSAIIVASPTVYAYSWLQSVGNPADALAGFERSAGWAWTLLWITSAVLLVPANAILWSVKKPWALWATFIYFAFFLLTNSFWLTPAARGFGENNSIVPAAAIVGPFTAVVIILLGFAIVFLDQFIVLRMREKTYPSQASTGSPIDVEGNEIEKEA